ACAKLADGVGAGMLDERILHVRHLAIVLEEIASADAGDGGGAKDAGIPVDRIERMRPKIGHLTAGVIPKPSEVVKGSIGIVGALRGRTEPEVVVKVGGGILIGRMA